MNMDCLNHSRKVRYICSKQTCQKDFTIGKYLDNFLCEQKCLNEHLSHPQYLIYIDQKSQSNAYKILCDGRDYFSDEINSFRRSVSHKLHKMIFLRRNITEIIDNHISMISKQLQNQQLISDKIPKLIVQLSKYNGKRITKTFGQMEDEIKISLQDRIDTQLLDLQEKQQSTIRNIKSLLVQYQRINYKQHQDGNPQQSEQDKNYQISIEGTAKDISKTLQKINFSQEKAKILHLQISQDTYLQFNVVSGKFDQTLESNYIDKNLAWTFMKLLISFQSKNFKQLIALSKQLYFVFGIKIYSAEKRLIKQKHSRETYRSLSAFTLRMDIGKKAQRLIDRSQLY